MAIDDRQKTTVLPSAKFIINIYLLSFNELFIRLKKFVL